jgi:hypothetical protein
MDGELAVNESNMVIFTDGVPHAGKQILFAYQTVTDGGGFTQGFDTVHAMTGDAELASRVEDWFEEHEEDPWPWELCQVRIPD